MAGLLTFLAPYVVTKLMVTITFVGFVAALTFLRIRTAPGEGGVKTTMLIGAALAFNWLWLVGFYNFLIGLCFLLVTAAIFRTWMSALNIRRSFAMAMLLLVTYFSHIVSFSLLIGSLVTMAVSTRVSKLKQNIAYLSLAAFPTVPLLASYKTSTGRRGAVSPVWRSLDNVTSLTSWTRQIRTADPFILISRNNFPFVGRKATFFAGLTPLLWISVALALLTVSTLKDHVLTANSIPNSPKVPFVLLFGMLVGAALFAPDDFGTENGGVLRERILLCGLAFFVPLFRSSDLLWNRLAQTILLFIVGFQTLALLEYSVTSSKAATEYFVVRNAIPPNDTLAAVNLIDGPPRFHSIPEGQWDGYFGFEQRLTILDNYELGHDLFPVVMKKYPNRNTARDLASANLIYTVKGAENFDKQLRALSGALSKHNQKIDTLIIWGRNRAVDDVVQKWFGPEPYFENGNVRLLHRKGLGEPQAPFPG